MENLADILFYTIDRSIKSYRQYAQKQLKDAGFEITIDQWLVLKSIHEDNSIAQQQIAEKVFKDVASITRIIEILVQKNYLSRSFHSGDRRRFELKLTVEGTGLLKKMQPYIEKNRNTAINGIETSEILKLQETLKKIINNVQESSLIKNN